MDAPDDLDAAVGRGDPDRWLASRFIGDAAARADVIALYALNLELARIADAVREPLMGEIRLTWWREAIEEIFAGRPVRRHPVVEALAGAIQRRGLTAAPFEAMIEARFADIDAEPFADLDAIEAYLDATAGGVMAPRARRPPVYVQSCPAAGPAGPPNCQPALKSAPPPPAPNDWRRSAPSESAGKQRGQAARGRSWL